jgi:hypothetical protein
MKRIQAKEKKKGTGWFIEMLNDLRAEIIV